MSNQLPTNAIEVEGLNKTYRGNRHTGPKRALKDVSLNIPGGSFFGLLGPNGAGNSALINILAGLVVKTSGEARIWDYDIDRDMRAARRSIGVVPQELNIDPFFTPYELLDLYAGLYGVAKKDRRTTDILHAVGLTAKRNDLRPVPFLVACADVCWLAKPWSMLPVYWCLMNPQRASMSNCAVSSGTMCAN